MRRSTQRYEAQFKNIGWLLVFAGLLFGLIMATGTHFAFGPLSSLSFGACVCVTALAFGGAMYLSLCGKSALIRAIQEHGQESIAHQIAHDIKSPLTALKLATGSVDLPEAQRALIDLAMKRIEGVASGSGDLKTVFPLVVEELLREKRTQYQDAKGLEIELDSNLPIDGVEVKIDPSVVSRALSNLIDNAAEATNLEGTLSVGLNLHESSIEVSVGDRGPGIPESLLEKLGTEPVNSTKPRGNGIGVYTSRTAIVRAGGSMSFESSGRGTTVRIGLNL